MTNKELLVGVLGIFLTLLASMFFIFCSDDPTLPVAISFIMLTIDFVILFSYENYRWKQRMNQFDIFKQKHKE